MVENDDKQERIDMASGMAVRVSTPELAQAVFETDPNMIATVSVTGIGIVLSRLLQLGDKATFDALQKVPPVIASMRDRVINKYYTEGGIKPTESFKYVQRPTVESLTLVERGSPSDLIDLTVLGAYTEVKRAQTDKNGVVDPNRKVIANLMIKPQLVILPTLWGVALAKAYAVANGAGSPDQIPAIVDQLINHNEAFYNLAVTGAPYGRYRLGFNPRFVMDKDIPPLPHLRCFSISSSLPFVKRLDRSRVTEGIEHAFDGHIFEKPIAAGHSKKKKVKGEGFFQEIVYTKEDDINFAGIEELDVDWWVAGGGLSGPLERGARGGGFGSIFALCEQSGWNNQDILRIYELYKAGKLKVVTSTNASPSGLTLKLARVPETLTDLDVYNCRPRICDIGYLAELYEIEKGKIGYRCPAEPADEYVRKGGNINRTIGCMCLCNCLHAAVGLGQRRGNYMEPKVFTLSPELGFLNPLLKKGPYPYSAARAIDLIKEQQRLLFKVN